ncbi:nucleotidyltransferase family protein [Bacteroidota bacterium]
MIKNIQDHIIQQSEPILEALRKLNCLPKTLTLFALNEKNQMVGSLTDGDVRRGFLNDKTLNDQVSEFITKDFHYLDKTIDVHYIKELKEKRIRLLPFLNANKEILKVYELYRLKSVLPLDAVIMAGGRGERLRPVTDTIPKSLIKLGNKPIIEHTIDHLILFGVENIYISVNYLKDQIKDYLGDGSEKGIKITYVEEEKALGTAGALSLVKNLKNDILLINSDLFTNIDYEDLYLAYLKNQAQMAVASVPYSVSIPYAILEEKENSVINFKEKPTNTHYANAGIYLIKKEIINNIPKNVFYNATDLMNDLIGQNKKIIQNPIIGYWIDIGKHEDLKKAKEIINHLNE